MHPGQRQRVQLTPRVLGWLALDLFGMALFAGGALFLAKGDALFVRFPTNMVEAAILLVGGAVLMLVGVANILRIMAAPSDAQASPGERR